MLKTDRFIQTMLYGYLFDNHFDERPHDGFSIYDDGTMSYINHYGQSREVEVAEGVTGTLHVMIVDAKSNDIVLVFNLRYDSIFCPKCECTTIHSVGTSTYCTECGHLLKGGAYE